MENKSPDAFRTISEVAEWLGVPTHVLRFWESRFTQVKPVKRAGGRRYYRPSDMMLLGGIRKLLHDDGMTIRGVQKLLREEGVKHVSSLSQPLDFDALSRDVSPSNVVQLNRSDEAEAPAARPARAERDVDAIEDAELVADEAEVPLEADEAPEQTPEAATVDSASEETSADVADSEPETADDDVFPPYSFEERVEDHIPFEAPVEAEAPQEDTADAPSIETYIDPEEDAFDDMVARALDEAGAGDDTPPAPTSEDDTPEDEAPAETPAEVPLSDLLDMPEPAAEALADSDDAETPDYGVTEAWTADAEQDFEEDVEEDDDALDLFAEDDPAEDEDSAEVEPHEIAAAHEADPVPDETDPESQMAEPESAEPADAPTGEDTPAPVRLVMPPIGPDPSDDITLDTAPLAARLRTARETTNIGTLAELQALADRLSALCAAMDRTDGTGKSA